MVVEEEKRNILTGILGTIAFHLLLLVVFLTAKIGKVKNQHQELITIEFSEEEYKSIDSHVFAARIATENPDEGFKPTSGTIEPIKFQSTCLGIL